MRRCLALACLVLSGCVNQMAANMAYGDVAAAAVADKKECAQGDKDQCLKFQRAQDRCREMIARGDTSAATLVCQRMVDEGVISVNPTEKGAQQP
jgi:hypothetical protein